MDFGVNNKNVLILASSSGLGKACSIEFAKEGANVMLFSSNKERLAQTTENIKQSTGNKNILYNVGDIKKKEDIENAVNKTVASFGSIDVLVNNTGGPQPGEFMKFSDVDWTEAYELTLLSFIRSMRAAIPHMKNQGGGKIVNSTSSSIKNSIDNLILSNTFRMGVVGLTKTLSQEVGNDNILINTIGPGRIRTERITALDKINSEKKGIDVKEVEAESVNKIPLGRYGKPEEYAKLA